MGNREVREVQNYVACDLGKIIYPYIHVVAKPTYCALLPIT